MQGLSWPEDRGEWLPIVAGRPLGQAHYEMIADESLKLPARRAASRLGKDTYTVVGLTRGMVAPAGDAMAFFTLRDAQAIQFDLPGEAVAPGSVQRGTAGPASIDLGPAPAAGDRAQPRARPRHSRPRPARSQRRAGQGPARRRSRPACSRIIASWPDVSVYTSQEQADLLLGGIVDKARRQLGLFRILLIIVSAIIMALILYTLTLDKLHDIAMLKLMGARNSVILRPDPAAGAAAGCLRLRARVVDRPVGLPVFPPAGADRSADLVAAGRHRGRHLRPRQPAGHREGPARRTQRGAGMSAPPDNTTPAVEVTHLTKVYGSGHTEVVAVRDATLAVARGEIVACSAPAARASPRC